MSHAGSSSNLPSAEIPATVQRSGLKRCAIAFAAFVIAAATTTLLWDALFIQVPFALFFAAVMLTAWLTSLGPALAVAVAGSMTTAWLMSASGRPALIAPAVLL